MLRLFCDVCDKEIKRNYVSERYKPMLGKFRVEIMVSFKDAWNSGEICKECLLKIINEGKER